MEKVNHQIDRHNQNITKMEKKNEDMEQKLLNGDILLPKVDGGEAEQVALETDRDGAKETIEDGLL